MKLNIIEEFSKEIIGFGKEKTATLEEMKKVVKSDNMECITKYIIKVKKLFYDDLNGRGNNVVDVLITELQNRYDISYEKAEEQIMKCIKDNNLPKPNRARYNYNICRELDKLPEVEIVL